jgi:acetylornithine deacetylase/succinyl-diaminopimelate desuccinylase-like protein
MVVKLKTGAKDVHSGLTGGLARNPIGELSQVISECYDARTGEVKIPGFYDGVRKANDSELDNFVKSGFTAENFKKAHELTTLRTVDARDGSQRIWAHPTFEVHGIVGGYTGPGVKTIVPHHAEAKISMRLVPDQDPQKVFDVVSKFIKERCPDCEIVKEGALKPYIGENTGKFAEAAKQAMTEAFGKEPAFTREGGSIGAVVSMHEVLAAPIMFLGLSLPEHGYHAINENYDWQQAAGGMRMFVNYFNLLAQMK